jgi:hypothetical protein
MRSKSNRRGQPLYLLITTVLALIITSLPIAVPAVSAWYHSNQINSLDYKQTYGYWEKVQLPSEYKTNTIHAATLPTGKILLVAGSGNNRQNFNSYNDNGIISVLKTVVYDPETGSIKLVKTPSDLFCSGHTLLQTGSVLVAGGTSGYELLEGEVKKPAGAMIIHNENPDSAPRTLLKGIKFINSSGKVYVSLQDVVIKPAMNHGDGHGKGIMHSSATVFVEAIAADSSYVTNKNEHYDIEGMKGLDKQNIYGQGGPMTLKKQDFRGDNKAYEFDPLKEEYVPVGDLNVSRWYPSLPVLTNGKVLAVSGLDNTGNITDTTEVYDPSTKKWTLGPNIALPTYPALFRTNNPDILFFSGSSAGYGPADKGRTPGFWNVVNDSFTPVSGLRDPDIVETSASVLLPPKKGSNDGSQSSRVLVAGGGGVGESPLSTSRTDIIDLASPHPSYTPGPNLPNKIRYLNLTVTPWDDVFANGGSTDYRAKGNSYSYKSYSINPDNYKITPMADELIGRTYHSGSLLLRDGRILVFGGDPLYGDTANTAPGNFEQSMEIYTPPQYFRSEKPVLNGVDSQKAIRGQELTFTTPDGSNIKTARLIPPSSSTHVTNLEQRSVEAIVKVSDGNVTIKLPNNKNIMPNGWYMLFVVNSDGVPGRAKMIEIIN